MKLNGFKKVFDNNKNYIRQNCLCIGVRTELEVRALRDMGKEAIGIDLVPYGSLVVDCHQKVNTIYFNLSILNLLMKIISGMVAGDSTNLNLEPYSSLRFS